jgi:hypothetical protein
MRAMNMVTLTPADTSIRELDHRTSDGVHVTLLWSERTNRVFVSAVDGRSGSSIRFEVAPGDALDAFHHPYAYAERQRRRDALAV